MINNTYEVLTPSGFKKFDGIRIVNNTILVEIILCNGNKLRCTTNHRLYSNGNELEVNHLNIGDYVDTQYGNHKIEEINIVDNNTEYFYDLINVEEHLYFTNSIISHNCDCSFITSGHGVVDGETLTWYMETYMRPPIEKRGIAQDFWIWEYADYTKNYVVCADVARGDGSDFSAFHVIEIETVTVVAEFKSKINTREFGRLLVAVATEYNNALLSVENSNIGWDTVQEILNIGYNNLYYTMKQPNYVDEHLHIFKGYDLLNKSDLVPGFTMSERTRPLVISRLQTYFLERVPIIYSERTINELLVFVWNGQKAQARNGYNDDLVMALAQGLWLRDTAIRLRTMGIELTEKTLQNIHKPIQTPNIQNNNYWNMTVGDNIESLRWLVKNNR